MARARAAERHVTVRPTSTVVLALVVWVAASVALVVVGTAMHFTAGVPAWAVDGVAIVAAVVVAGPLVACLLASVQVDPAGKRGR